MSSASLSDRAQCSSGGGAEPDLNLSGGYTCLSSLFETTLSFNRLSMPFVFPFGEGIHFLGIDPIEIYPFVVRVDTVYVKASEVLEER